jgi:hypothetical protein
MEMKEKMKHYLAILTIAIFGFLTICEIGLAILNAPFPNNLAWYYHLLLAYLWFSILFKLDKWSNK